ncbi:hypothetical protein [Geoalkalibacter sp.]|uniref:hypothetical protein n=1 Tax=Geoalkalibacter sp. TaxID=3041440 RepID=UPI00272DD8D5|nr:hypothetical protein [Geoalkalibacter sp.]
MKKLACLLLLAGALSASPALAVEKDQALLEDFVVVAKTQAGSNHFELVYYPQLNRTCHYIYHRTDGLRGLDCWPGKPDAAKEEKAQ